MSITLEPIGRVQNAVVSAVDEAWGDVVSDIVLSPPYAAGLQGIEDWSHVVVLFLMHEAVYEPSQHLVRRPRERADMPLLGVFAQRARHRPNPIGISAVKIVEVAPPTLRVRGLDAIDGTPILDIKPYAPIYDGAHDPQVPTWFIRLMQGYF